jgi:hypothetical protein
VTVQRILQDLGRELYDNAEVAPRKIHLKPTRRDGKSMDSTAILNIVFELASSRLRRIEQMRKAVKLSLLILVPILLATVTLAQSSPGKLETHEQHWSTTADPGAAHASVQEMVDRIIAAENREIETISSYHPIVESYVQVFDPKTTETPILSKDYYYLGRTDFSGSKAIGYHSMLSSNDQRPKKGFREQDFRPFGFVRMAYIDRKGFDRQHYSFKYAGKEFLGEVRCVAFDVKPLPHTGNGRFYGRIWAEDKNYTVVRFNGIYLPVHTKGGYNAHFESWRLNVQPDLWLPAYSFAEETDLKIHTIEIKHLNDHDRLRFKAQTRFWGYNLKETGHEQEFTNLTVDGTAGVNDTAADADHDQSPAEAQRRWQNQAENNVLSALERTGLVARAGEVDKSLDTVVNNLEVTNNLDIEPPIRCRILTTSTFDLFVVGHVIVVSRGLLDVLPDEATLATILSQELGEIVVSRPAADRYAFYDLVQLPPLEALKHLSFKPDKRDRQASREKAIAILRNSPYKDKLASAGLFLKQFEQDSQNLRALVSPHLGDSVYVASELTGIASTLQPENVNQVAALPLGARIKLNPWTGEMELTKTNPTVLVSAREKMPLQVVPFAPYLTRYTARKSSEALPTAAHENVGDLSPRSDK